MNGNDFSKRREFGDYQTPIKFSEEVCRYLKKDLKLNPDVVIEPTCGLGNFLQSSYNIFNASKYIGIEINEDYTNEAKRRFLDKDIKILNADLFSFDFLTIANGISNLEILIVGNPPWVNNSTLSSLNSKNQPIKTNFKGMKGIDAITGSANFDICEFMILKLIDSFKNSNTSIALLCKTIVARNVFEEMKRLDISFRDAKVLTFDAKKKFDISADSCLFYLRLSPERISQNSCQVMNFSEPNKMVSRFGFRNNKFYSNLDNNNMDFDGSCCFEWRQGIKHDCSKVMELSLKNLELVNGNGEIVDIENEYVFPLIKSSHLKKYLITETIKYVIVTQHKVKEDTSHIQDVAPKTWDYLNGNIENFRARKSSIYKNSPDFSMFGIGDYSYSNYKVGISGFYKNPIFSLLTNNKPIMMDDTCYFLSFNTYNDAYITMLILNSDMVQAFIKSIAFLDSKRPYTKKVLERIDFMKIINNFHYDLLLKIEKKLNLLPILTNDMYKQFVALVLHK